MKKTKDTVSPIRPTVINGHLNAVYPALVLLAAMELELFTFLKRDGKKAEKLAEEMSVRVSKLRPLLYALVSAGLLEHSDGKFFNTSEAEEFLVKGETRYFGDSYSTYQDLWRSTLFTAQSIQKGIPQAKHDFTTMSSEELYGFIIGLDSGAGATARRLHRTYDFSRFQTILDAGGGSGGLAVELANLCSGSKLTVLELPSIASIARQRILESKVSNRVEVVDGDLTNSRCCTQNFDAIILRSVIQVLGLEKSASVIKNLSACLSEDGEFYVIGRVLNDDRLGPAEAVSANVMFLNIYDAGGAFTISEYRTLFVKNGLFLRDRVLLSGGYTMMVFVKN